MKKILSKKNKLTYKDAGVDIHKSEKILNDLKPNIIKTFDKSVINNYGGFSSILDIKKLGYKDPLLLASTDGVGTKLKIAIEANNLEFIGIDLVAMCVNDILAQGGIPHYFLDYIAIGKLNSNHVKTIITSITKGCLIAKCALVGGETAEMPGHYIGKNFDIAGFSIGAVERDLIFKKTSIQKGDLVVALESNGIHSNGFSLIRKIIKDNSIDILKDNFSFNKDKKISEVLLKPTYIYTDILRTKTDDFQIKGITHITGGGLIENPPRSFNDKLTLSLDLNTYKIDPLFMWIKENAKLSWPELLKTFNCGIGLLLYVDKKNINKLLNYLSNFKFKSWIVGEMIDNKNSKSVIFKF